MIIDSLKSQNVNDFYFEEKAAKKTHIFHFLKGRFFIMAGSINLNFRVF